MGIFELSDRFPRKCLRMGKAQCLEHPALPDFARISDTRIIVGKDMCRRIDADLVEILGACLGKDNGPGHLDRLENMGINPPVSKNNLDVRNKAWVK